MTETETLADVATKAARKFETKAGRQATPLEIAQLVLHLKEAVICWPNAAVGTACKITWDALRTA